MILEIPDGSWGLAIEEGGAGEGRSEVLLVDRGGGGVR
jgi:hypothetical protein